MRPALREINRLAAERARLRETLLVEVGDHDDRGAQKERGRGRAQGPRDRRRRSAPSQPVVTPADTQP